eukprot:gene2714-12585_t
MSSSQLATGKPVAALNIPNRLNPNNMHYDDELAARYRPLNIPNRLSPNNMHYDDELAARYRRMSKAEKERLWEAERLRQQQLCSKMGTPFVSATASAFGSEPTSTGSWNNLNLPMKTNLPILPPPLSQPCSYPSKFNQMLTGDRSANDLQSMTNPLLGLGTADPKVPLPRYTPNQQWVQPSSGLPSVGPNYNSHHGSRFNSHGSTILDCMHSDHSSDAGIGLPVLGPAGLRSSALTMWEERMQQAKQQQEQQFLGGFGNLGAPPPPPPFHPSSTGLGLFPASLSTLCQVPNNIGRQFISRQSDSSSNMSDHLSGQNSPHVKLQQLQQQMLIGRDSLQLMALACNQCLDLLPKPCLQVRLQQLQLQQLQQQMLIGRDSPQLMDERWQQQSTGARAPAAGSTAPMGNWFPNHERHTLDSLPSFDASQGSSHHSSHHGSARGGSASQTMLPDVCLDLGSVGGVQEHQTSLLCPLTRKVMKEPVIAADGVMYDRWALLQMV